MSVDTSVEEDAGESVEDVGRGLGEAIADLPEYEAYLEAQDAVQADDELQEQIETFERKREEFMMARQAGEADQADLRDLQAAQNELHSQPLMAEFLEAQNELEARLERVNDAISEPLELDFGQTAGGCCEN